MTRRNKIILAIGLGVIVVLGAASWLKGGTPVETVTASRGAVVQTVEDTGYVQAKDNYELFAAGAARIVSVPVTTGQQVTAGQVLVIMDSPDLTVQKETVASQLAQAESGAEGTRRVMDRTRAQLTEAKNDLKRSIQLFKAGGMSAADYEQAVLAVKELEKTLEEQATQLTSYEKQTQSTRNMLNSLSNQQGQLELKSPLSGVVMNLPARAEQVVAPGALLVRVGNADLLEVKADILSDDLAGVKVGGSVKITAPVMGNQILNGQVKQIYPQAEEKTSALGVIQRRVSVIISLTDKANLQPGYEVRVEIATLESKNVVRVPLEAVATNEQGNKQVTVIINGKAEPRAVQTGISDRQYWEIKSGLKAGDRVVRDAGLKLKAGARVSID